MSFLTLFSKRVLMFTIPSWVFMLFFLFLDMSYILLVFFGRVTKLVCFFLPLKKLFKIFGVISSNKCFVRGNTNSCEELWIILVRILELHSRGLYRTSPQRSFQAFHTWWRCSTASFPLGNFLVSSTCFFLLLLLLLFFFLTLSFSVYVIDYVCL